MSIPNGAARSAIQNSLLNLSGQLPGAPDIILDVARYPYHGLRIEMKVKGGVISDEQIEVHSALRAQGYRVDVAWNLGEAQEVFINYISQPSWRDAIDALKGASEA